MISPDLNLEVVEIRGMQAGRVPFTASVKQAVQAAIHTLARGEPIPIAERAPGIDTSWWNGNMNFGYNPLLRFACIKATQGVSILDGQYLNSRTKLITLGKPFHAYHFLTTSDGAAQANWFLSQIREYPGPIYPVVDVELLSVPASLIRACVHAIYNEMKLWPMIYTSAYFWSMVTGTADKKWVAERCKLWVAHWDTDSPILPPDWTQYYIHQHSANNNKQGQAWGAPPGAEPDMDLNRCRKSWLAQFESPIHDSWAWDVTNGLRTLGQTVRDPE